jgi:hypothetical protein
MPSSLAISAAEEIEKRLPPPTMTDKKRKQPMTTTTTTIVRLERYEWLARFDTLAHNKITLYEWEVYTRTRMCALLMLCTGADESKDAGTRKEAMDFWLLRKYPHYNGAKQHLLEAIGADAVARAISHEVIAMGYLALIARHNAEMRESLIYAELLWYRYKKSLLDGDEADDDELRQLCDQFDRFWARSDGNIADSRSPHFVSSARKVERDWMEQMAKK